MAKNTKKGESKLSGSDDVQKRKKTDNFVPPISRTRALLPTFQKKYQTFFLWSSWDCCSYYTSLLICGVPFSVSSTHFSKLMSTAVVAGWCNSALHINVNKSCVSLSYFSVCPVFHVLRVTHVPTWCTSTLCTKTFKSTALFSFTVFFQDEERIPTVLCVILET